jgi:hypothetical protein
MRTPMPIPKLDGHAAQRVMLAFSGAVQLDLADDDLALLEAVGLGHDVQLLVTRARGWQGLQPHAPREGEGDDEDVVAYQAKLKVLSAGAVR